MTLSHSSHAFSFRLVVYDFALGFGYLAGGGRKKKGTTPSRNQTAVTTDHSDFAKCNLGTFEECEMQAHFPWQFQGEVNVVKDIF